MNIFICLLYAKLYIRINVSKYLYENVNEFSIQRGFPERISLYRIIRF